MERIRQNGKENITSFRRPKFPCLKPKHPFEILQYKLGRDLIIDKINHIAWKFQYYLEPMIKPSININTEPWEILIWYYEASTEILKNLQNQSNHLICNIDQYINQVTFTNFEFDDDNHACIEIYDEYYVNEINSLGINWVHKTPVKYWRTIYSIFKKLEEYGCFTIWDYIESYEPLEILEDELQYGIESEDEEYTQTCKEMLSQASEIKKHKIDLSDCDTWYVIPKAENQEEQFLNECIEDCILCIEQIGDFSFYSMQNQEDYDNSLCELGKLYNIVYNSYEFCEFTEKSFYSDMIESQANSSGISPWRFQTPREKSIEIEDFDYSTYALMENLFKTLYKLQKHYLDV